MKRRDSEGQCPKADELFKLLKIFDLQGLLHHEGVYAAGVECYQTPQFDEVDWGALNPQHERARALLCAQLEVPYYVLIASEEAQRYRLTQVSLNERGLTRSLEEELSVYELMDWWRARQPFTQHKPMYNAHARLAQSLIDRDLTAHALAWGVNIDGFTLDAGGRVSALIERRVSSHERQEVSAYDPSRFFFGTPRRAGDEPAWRRLKALADRLAVPLILMTFDTSHRRQVGVAKVADVCSQRGLIYQDGPPHQHLLEGEEATRRLPAWLAAQR